MVHHQDEHVVLGAQPQEARPQNRPPREVEGPARCATCAPRGLGLALVGGQRTQILDSESDRRGRLDDLTWTGGGLLEPRPQRFVTAHDLRQRA